jgi:eukaryotic-like serine/threonine-protein kinase
MVPTLATGSELDGFRIGEKLHQGGMATIWRVSRPDIAVPILLKEPVLFDCADAASIVGFEMEQMILPRLSGPHVPRLFAAGDFPRKAYLVIEEIQGPTLIHCLDALPLGNTETAAIGTQIAAALADLHRQHVIHLDIKPSNVMRRDSGEAVLIDFGLSRHDQLPDLLQAEFRLPMGTGPYISPEQLLHQRGDPRSDMFALGVLLYLFATGFRPFGNPRGNLALRQRLWRDPVPPRALRPDLSPWLQEIILRCLEVDPEARYPTAAQLAFDLAHPSEVRLTPRAHRLRRDGAVKTVPRWFRTVGMRAQSPRPLEALLQTAPIMAVAVELSAEAEPLGKALRAMTRRLLETMPQARLACINVLKIPRIGAAEPLDADGRNRHVERLIALKGWAQPLELDTSRLTFHVLEAPDPAAALIQFAGANGIDQIVMGARSSSHLRRYLGSVSSRVVAEAPCTVTVVRVAGPAQTPAEEAPGQAATAPAADR